MREEPIWTCEKMPNVTAWQHFRAGGRLHLGGDQDDLREHDRKEQISGTPVDVEHNARLGSRAAGGRRVRLVISLSRFSAAG